MGPAPAASDDERDLEARARHARARLDLYKAKAYGMRPTSDTRMRELERACAQAEARLQAARAEARLQAAKQSGTSPTPQTPTTDAD